MTESIASGGEKKKQGNWRDQPYCEKCRRNHYGECRTRTCYQCGSPDHLKKHCPQLKKEDKKTADSFTPSRVFHLTQSEATDSKTVVTGQLSFAGTFLSVLFDSGATHSFVATRVMDSLCRPGSELDRPKVVILPRGDRVVSRRGIRALPVTVDGRCNAPKF